MPDVKVNPPFEPYTGSQPFIFVSYAHLDASDVYPIISFLNDKGFRVWYDEGIPSGEVWRRTIARQIDACGQFLVFISKASVESEEVRKEIDFATDCKKNFLVIFLEEKELPPEIRYQIGTLQAILFHEMQWDRFIDKLLKSLDKALCDPSRAQLSPSNPPSVGRGKGTDTNGKLLRRIVLAMVAITIIIGLSYALNTFWRKTLPATIVSTSPKSLSATKSKTGNSVTKALPESHGMPQALNPKRQAAPAMESSQAQPNGGPSKVPQTVKIPEEPTTFTQKHLSVNLSPQKKEYKRSPTEEPSKTPDNAYSSPVPTVATSPTPALQTTKKEIIPPSKRPGTQQVSSPARQNEAPPKESMEVRSKSTPIFQQPAKVPERPKAQSKTSSTLLAASTKTQPTKPLHKKPLPASKTMHSSKTAAHLTTQVSMAQPSQSYPKTYSITPHGTVLLDISQKCGKGFTCFDQQALTEAVKVQLQRFDALPKKPVRIALTAGYKRESFDEDTGTTIRAYAAFALCDPKSGQPCQVENVHSKTPCIYADESSLIQNENDAIDDIIKSIVYLIRHPHQKNGELSCQK
ncbi:MAG: TIR domain-containing protein [Syntrophobacteraceae bacterium]